MKHLYNQLKIQLKAFIVGILLVVSVTTGYSQTTIFSENFESAGVSHQILSTSPSSYHNWAVYIPTSGPTYWYITSSYYSYCMINGSYSLSTTSDDYYCTYGMTGGYPYSCNKIAYTTFSATGYSSLTLSFNYKAGGETGYDYGKVCYSTDGSTWTDLAATYNNKASTTAVTNLALPAALNGLATVYIGFRWRNDNNYVDPSVLGFVVDDIVIKGSAACSGTPAAPVIAAATNVGPNSFTANWSASANATAYYLDVSTSSSFTTLLTNYNNKSVGNVTTYNVTGLTTGVTYYYRVRAKCVGTSGNSSNASCTTAANYCAAGPTSGTGDGITRVTFNSINNTSAINQWYADYTSISTTVSPNLSYSLTVKVTTYGGGALQACQKAWIDWDHNGTFNTTTEEINLGTATGTNINTSLSPKTVTVPAGAVFGPTRMRVMTRQGSSAPTSCDNFNYGECEDYTIIVGNPPGNAYGIYSASAICSGCLSDCEIYGDGGSGTAGCLVCSPTDASYTNVLISDYPVITATNKSCYNTDVTVTTAASSPVWTGSSSPLTGSGASKTFQYTGTGRKDIVLATTAACTGAAAQTATVNTAIPDNGCTSNSTVVSTITVPSYGSCKINTANMSIKVNITHGDAQDVMIYLKAPNGKLLCVSTGNGSTGNNYTNTIFSDGGATNITSGTAPFTGTYRPEGATGSSNCGAPTSGVTTFATLGGSSYNPTGVWTLYVGDQYSGSTGTFVDWTLTLPASSGSGGTTTNTYTGFANMMMAPPSAGAVKGTATGCAGGTYTYSSTAAGTPGFTYAWSVSPSTGTTVVSPAGSSTNIQFPTTLTTYTISCVQTSECCGALSAITYTTTITAAPTAPTVTVGNPSLCVGSSTTLTPTAPANCSFSFYDALTGGTLLSNTVPYTTPTLNTKDTIYVEAISTTGCASSPRTPIIITPVAVTPPTVSGVTRCGAGEVTLDVTSPGAAYTYNWYTGSCTGSLLQSNNGISYTITNASATTTYYVSATPRGCGSSTCTPVTVTINGIGSSYTWGGTVSGANNWFTAANWGGAGCIPTCASDVTIPSSGSYTYAPDIGYNAGGAAAVKSITLTNGCALTFSDAKAELSICGNFTHNGTLTTNGKGTVTFNGTVAQTYTKTTGTGDFNDVVLNNTASTATLTLASDLTLGTGGNFTFVSGKVITGTNNLIIKNTESSAVSGHSLNRYVEGNLRRYINTGTPTSYDFPVGNAAKGYELANVNFITAPATITYLTANFQAYSVVPSALGGTECFATYNRSALDHGFWDISANNSLNNTGLYNMTLYNRGYTNAQSGSSIMSMHTGSASWGLLNGDGTASTCINAPVTALERRNMKGFSKFGVAQSTSVLPIELLSFDAIYNGSTTDVNWETASETNNNYFTIERSRDASEFMTIAKVPSKAKGGNSTSRLSYTLNDPDVQKGVYYYRLKQTDHDGKTTVSSIATVSVDDHQPLTVTPNPTENSADISFESYANGVAMLKIYDTRGRLVLAKEVMCNKGHNTHTIDLQQEISGVFYIVLNVGDKIYNTKLLKQ